MEVRSEIIVRINFTHLLETYSYGTAIPNLPGIVSTMRTLKNNQLALLDVRISHSLVYLGPIYVSFASTVAHQMLLVPYQDMVRYNH